MIRSLKHRGLKALFEGKSLVFGRYRFPEIGV